MDEIKEIYKEIKKANKIVITTHIRADGDCVGSSIGLREIIKSTFPEKTVKATYEYLGYLPFLGKPDNVTDEDFETSLIISVDNASLKRANDPRIAKSNNIIKIDHHPNVEPFGKINWVEDERCACAEMIFDFYLRFKSNKISKLGIEALFTGIITDSGRFKYAGVTGNTLIKVGMMYQMGLDGSRILNILDETTLEELDFKGYVLTHLEKTENGVLYIKITPEAREKYNVTYDDASNMVGSLSNVKGYPIWALFNELSPTEIRCRVRSLGIKINDVCARFGGGGHENASGIVAKDYATVDEIIKSLDERAKEEK